MKMGKDRKVREGFSLPDLIKTRRFGWKDEEEWKKKVKKGWWKEGTKPDENGKPIDKVKEERKDWK
jgi:hypothetical protein